jgi:hypothetical protein
LEVCRQRLEVDDLDVEWPSEAECFVWSDAVIDVAVAVDELGEGEAVEDL